MNESEKTKSGDEQAKPSEPEIIEAQVIEETPDPEMISPEPNAATGGGANKLSLKVAWGSVALLVSFGMGVYFAPKFVPGLENMGLLTPREAEIDTTISAFDPTPLQAAIADLKTDFSRQQEILAQHEVSLAEGFEAQSKLVEDVALIAGQGLVSAESATHDLAAIKTLQDDISRLSEGLAQLSVQGQDENPQISSLKGSLALARAEVAGLKARVSLLEEAVQQVQSGALEANPRGRLVLALSRIKDNALIGQPFVAALKALRSDFAALPALDQQMIGADLSYLETLGNSIVPYDKLVAEFDTVAIDIVKAEEKAEGGLLSSLFTVRRTDVSATGLDAELVKAERYLLSRDVQGAVDVLSALEGPARGASEAWRNAADMHVKAIHAFNRLIERISSSQVNSGAGSDGGTP